MATRKRAAPPLEASLSYQLHLLHKLSDRDSQQAYLRELGLTLADGRCLATVGAFAPLSVVDLARRANLNKGQASRAAQALVASSACRMLAWVPPVRWHDIRSRRIGRGAAYSPSAAASLTSTARLGASIFIITCAR